MTNKKNEVGTGTIIEGKATHRHDQGLIPKDVRLVLRIDQGTNAGCKFDLSRGGEFVLGRTGADIVLDDEMVSRKHAELGLYGEYAYVLRDLASTNGTFVNNKRIAHRVTLQHGDRIRMGSTLLTFLIVEGAGEAARSSEP